MGTNTNIPPRREINGVNSDDSNRHRSMERVAIFVL